MDMHVREVFDRIKEDQLDVGMRESAGVREEMLDLGVSFEDVPLDIVILTDMAISFKSVSRPLNPDQRIKKLIKTAITQIEKAFGNKYSPTFHAGTVLEALSERLKNTQANRATDYDNFDVFDALLMNEINRINHCLSQGCSDFCAKLLSRLKAEKSVCLNCDTPKTSP
jgi:hypothetical protein